MAEPHAVNTERKIPNEQGGALWSPPSLRGLPAVGLGLHGFSFGHGDQGQSVRSGGDGALSERGEGEVMYLMFISKLRRGYVQYTQIGGEKGYGIRAVE